MRYQADGSGRDGLVGTGTTEAAEAVAGDEGPNNDALEAADA